MHAEFSTEDARWTVTVERTDTGETTQLTSSFLWSTSGYYRYDEGFTPEFAGVDDYEGQLIHPPALARGPRLPGQAGRRDRLRRHRRHADPGAGQLRRRPRHDAAADADVHHQPADVRQGVGRDVQAPARQARAEAGAHPLPDQPDRVLRVLPGPAEGVARLLRKLLERQLPDDVSFDEHFKPPYDPWDQRLCAVPGGDLFKALRQHSVDIVTDHIDRFTPKGILLKSGQELEADIIITATGLNLQIFGGATLGVDGQVVKPADTMAYKGLMLSDIPNFAFIIGYTNASWTLKADLVCEYVVKLIQRMDETGTRTVVPRRDPLGDRGAVPRLRGRLRDAVDRLAAEAGLGVPVAAEDELLQGHPGVPEAGGGQGAGVHCLRVGVSPAGR